MVKKHSILHIVLMVVAAAGLLVITGSFFMALGIFILLVLAEYIIIDRVAMSRRKKEREEKDNANG